MVPTWRSVAVLGLAGLVIMASTGCAGLLSSAQEGLKDGISGDSLQPLPREGKPLLEYGLDALVYLLVYAAGSLGKGKIRAIKEAAKTKADELVPDEKPAP